jgi:hypothetical protein
MLVLHLNPVFTIYNLYVHVANTTNVFSCIHTIRNIQVAFVVQQSYVVIAEELAVRLAHLSSRMAELLFTKNLFCEGNVESLKQHLHMQIDRRVT